MPGEAIDFSSLVLDLDEQDNFFKDIYTAARHIGWGRTTTYGALARDLGAGPEGAPRCRCRHGQESGGPDHPLATASSPPATSRAAFPRPAASTARCACSNSKVSASARRPRRKPPSISETLAQAT
ncbi:MAG: MGMT family protein [Asticcacaulis sp.]